MSGAFGGGSGQNSGSLNPAPGGSSSSPGANRSRKKMTEAERIKEMEKAALSAAILKPFIESLFDDNRDGGGATSSQKEKERAAQGAAASGSGQLTNYRSAAIELPLQPAVSATIGMSGMPSMRYHEALYRETAKPFRLNTLVSIDAAPLPTRTSAPVYTELIQPRTGQPPQHAACLDHTYRQQLRDSFTQVLRSGAGGNSPTKLLEHQRGREYTRNLNDSSADDEGDEATRKFEKELIAKANQMTGLGGGGGTVRPPEIYGPLKQGQMLEDAHLEMLMKTVSQVKEQKMYEGLWGQAKGRFAW